MTCSDASTEIFVTSITEESNNSFKILESRVSHKPLKPAHQVPEGSCSCAQRWKWQGGNNLEKQWLEAS